MKKSLLIALLATLPLSMTSVWAVEAHHADTNNKPMMAMTDKEKEMHMAKMQANMLAMHEQMHKIMAATTPQDRERHMQEHAKMMHGNMQMMHEMRGMKGSNAKGEKMDGAKKAY